MYDISGENRRIVEAVRASNHACRDNPLINQFFSEQNINTLQTNIRIIMKEKYGYTISRQDDTELVLIMRGVFNANDSVIVYPCIQKQVEFLNAKTLEFVIPQIRSNIRHYLGYLRDISLPYGGAVLDRPSYTSQRGEFTLYNN